MSAFLEKSLPTLYFYRRLIWNVRLPGMTREQEHRTLITESYDMVLRCCLIMLIAFLVSFTQVRAQPVIPKHRFGAGVGVLNEAHRDELISPLRYSGVLFPVQVEYLYRGVRNRHHLSVIYAEQSFHTSISQGNIHTQEGYLIEVRGQYARRIAHSGDERFQLLAGMLVDSYNSFTKHWYRSSIEEYTGIYYLAFSPALTVTRTLRGQDEVAFNIATSGIAYVIRPPYSVKGAWKPRVVTLDRFVKLAAGLTYERDLSHLFSVRAGYLFGYYWTDLPFDLEAVQQRLHLVLVFKR